MEAASGISSCSIRSSSESRWAGSGTILRCAWHWRRQSARSKGHGSRVSLSASGASGRPVDRRETKSADDGGRPAVITRIDQARPAVVYGLLVILMAAVFVPVSFLRLVDGDEGTYLLVSRLVADGRVPYHDFFYPQMFLLPYVYGAWMKVVGYSWYAARLLSACFS